MSLHYFSSVAANAVAFQDIALDKSIHVTQRFPPRPSGEAMIPLIEALTGGKQGVFIGNILNTGNFINDLPTDFEVKVPIRCERGHFWGQPVSRLPRELTAHILHSRVAPIEIELETYRLDSRELLRQLILLDPWSRSLRQVDAFLEEILSLPEHSEMRQYHR